ncbi:MAG: hypothetical protein OEM59_13820 [Rhodospirillales bacterium]|nr:hypothetical protein [Rhodospirillales bacterium]
MNAGQKMRARRRLAFASALAGVAARVAAGVAAGAGQLLPAAGAAETLDNALAYTTCMQLVREAPAQAFEEALAWEADNGGRAARHCAAMALLGLDQPAEAAGRLQALGEELAPGAPEAAGEVLGQAGRAWLSAGESGHALAAQDAALKLTRDSVELLIDRSISLATAGRYAAAVADLDRAAGLAPYRAEVLVLRASAQRRLGALDLARRDLATALWLLPDDPDGLLERGILRRQTGDTAGARDDWLRAATLDPEGPAGAAARARLEKLDVKVE